MKKNLYMSLVMALITVFTLSFTACSKDDDKQPEPQNTNHEAKILLTIAI